MHLPVFSYRSAFSVIVGKHPFFDPHVFWILRRTDGPVRRELPVISAEIIEPVKIMFFFCGRSYDVRCSDMVRVPIFPFRVMGSDHFPFLIPK